MNNIPKIIFVIPFRNRENEKFAFLSIMKNILEDYNTNEYKIYFIKQLDNRMFNRGAIKNIGFYVVKNLYPNNYKNITLVFNDIDVCPLSKKYIQDYSTTTGKIKHFYGFKFALGGIVSITCEDFEKCNGFMNNWGWGFEDNYLNDNAKKNNIHIDRSIFFEKGSNNFLDIHHGSIKYINNNEIINYINKNTYDNLRTLKNIDYVINEDNIFYWNNKNTIFDVDVKNFDTAISFSSTKNNYRVHDVKIKGNKVNIRNIGLNMKFL